MNDTMNKEDLITSLGRQWDVTQEDVTLNDIEYTFWRLSDPDALLDDETLAASHPELSCQPYWAQAWDASYGLAWHLSRRSLVGLKILDLGCGLGITGRHFTGPLLSSFRPGPGDGRRSSEGAPHGAAVSSPFVGVGHGIAVGVEGGLRDAAPERKDGGGVPRFDGDVRGARG